MAPKALANSSDSVPSRFGHRTGRHVQPELQARRPQRRGRFTPLALQPVNGWRDNQDHQRNLEVEIGKRQSGEAQQVEAGLVDIEAEHGLEDHHQQAQPAERGDEGEGQRQAGKIGGDARKGHHRRADRAGKAASDDRQRDGEADRGAEKGRSRRHPDRNPEGADDLISAQIDNVLQCEVALAVDEGRADEE